MNNQKKTWEINQLQVEPRGAEEKPDNPSALGLLYLLAYRMQG